MAILGHASKALRNSQNYLDGFDQSLELEPPWSLFPSWMGSRQRVAGHSSHGHAQINPFIELGTL